MPHSNLTPEPTDTRRQSFGMASVSEFLAQCPPPTNLPSNKWQDIPIRFLFDKDVAIVDPDTPIEEASALLIDNDLSSIPIRAAKGSDDIARVFDYSDLTAFLLLVLHIDDAKEATDAYRKLSQEVQNGTPITAYQVAELGKNKDPFMTVPATSTLGDLAEILATGIRRVAVVDENRKILSIASQRQLIRFLWTNVRAFPALEPLMSRTIHSLDIGSSDFICINGDKKVISAFRQMHETGIGSLAVVDSQYRLLGNISLVDVKYVTRSSSIYLLNRTCGHFLSVIKSEQGIRAGKDSAPAFNVYESSTFAFTMAKVVATQCHRLWLVQSPSCPPSPKSSNSHLMPGSNAGLKVNQLLGMISLTDMIYVILAQTKGTLPQPTARIGRRGSTSSGRSHSKVSMDSSYRR
ncbi:inducer-sexual development Sds23/Moc1 [Schizosaccharomyces japonicus yFS275]|uniref:Inducer-sexual development Sds23/Moc1 n=1 Tax=Schizosaccharomyces japonicus (strain yFS275 / FY16936) TaxID=402676 RepID=B6K2B2_SCHJY|nr:inducer-sexual development Sds23/Moc1 [Schizosaccharomyces japonicus yFS275]EEB07293.1 inducer-sexual development Sds23/Moc1 [Schizosaccharomyces japonicus yFS275]